MILIRVFFFQIHVSPVLTCADCPDVPGCADVPGCTDVTDCPDVAGCGLLSTFCSCFASSTFCRSAAAARCCCLTLARLSRDVTSALMRLVSDTVWWMPICRSLRRSSSFFFSLRQILLNSRLIISRSRCVSNRAHHIIKYVHVKYFGTLLSVYQ